MTEKNSLGIKNARNDPGHFGNINLIKFLQDIFPDKATGRKILSLFIRCPNTGCDWTGELREKKVSVIGMISTCTAS